MFGGKLAKNLSQALAFFQQGEWHSAQRLYQQILHQHPQQTDALQCLGMIAAQTGQLSVAIDYFRRAVQVQPQSPGFHYNLGHALQAQGDLTAAIACYQQTLALDANHLAACYNLASIYLERGQPREAIPPYQQALRLQPDLTSAQANLGNAYLDLGEIESAIACYQQVLSTDPQHSRTLYNLGLAHQAQGQINQAIACYQTLLALEPEDTSAYTHLGNAYLGTGQTSAAISAYQQAISLVPDSVDAHMGLGLAGLQQLDLEVAIEQLSQACQLAPQRVEAHFNRAIALLLSGDFKSGWVEYEWRLRQPDVPQRHFLQPRWQGSDLQGQTLFLHAEQGFGDAIQLIRYIPLLADRGGKLVVECYRPLRRLFTSLPGIDQLITYGDPLPGFDLQAPLLSLPGILGTTLSTIPASIPYIVPPLREFPVSIRGNGCLTIGIVWASGANSATAYQRSCELEWFLPLAKLPGVKLFSLQVGISAAEAQALDNVPEIDNLCPYLHDFADTAAAIADLDLVISVDTAVAHLAGALGQQVWVLLPYVPDWRWLLQRSDSPWYPTMRLFRQPQPGAWREVFQQVRTDLEQLCQCSQ